MTPTDRTRPHDRDETAAERADRNLLELVSELRVALPGVQVLFAFLLVVPFNRRFEDVTDFQEKVYFVTLLLTAVSSALLIAPSVHHRVHFRKRRKEGIVTTGNKLALAGLVVLGLAMIGAVILVTDFVFGPATTAVVAVALGVLFPAVWFLAPIRASE